MRKFTVYMVLILACATPSVVMADDDWPGLNENPFDNPLDNWSKTFDDKQSQDDTIKYDKPRKNSQLDNEWSNPRRDRKRLSDIHQDQFKSRYDD